MSGSIGGLAHQALAQNYCNPIAPRTLSTASAKTAALAPGRYRIVSDVDCFVAQGPQSSVTATTSSVFLPAGAIDFVEIDETNDSIAGILASGTGNLYLARQIG